MKIVLFVGKDFRSNLAYHLLKEQLQKHQVSVYCFKKSKKKKRRPWPKAFLEIDYYAKKFFYNELPEIMAQNNIGSNFEFFNETFRSFKWSTCTNVNDPSFIEEIKQLEPDLFLSIRFSGIFKDEIIAVPKKGILNLHSAILPDYKGIMGTLHNFKDNKPDYGCTLHYIDRKTIDTGPIVATAKEAVVPGRSLFWHTVKVYQMGSALIADALQKLETADRLPALAQDPSQGNYFSFPTEADFAVLEERAVDIFKHSDFLELLMEHVSPELLGKLDLQPTQQPVGMGVSYPPLTVPVLHQK